MLGFSLETDITHGAACRHRNSHRGRTRGSVRYVCTQSLQRMYVPGLFSSSRLKHGRQNSGLSERYREDDPAAALGVIISRVLIRAQNENSVKIK